MNITELGAKLREAREGRNWTVADVADALKIPSRILKGIEDGSDHLPHSVYVFHFIKDYARHLGFTAEETAAMTASLEGFEKASQPVRDASVRFTSVRPSPVPKILGGALKLALFVALGIGGYNAYLHFFAERNAAQVIAQKNAQEEGIRSGQSSAWNAPQPSAAVDDASKAVSRSEGDAPAKAEEPVASSGGQPVASNEGLSSQEEKMTLPPQPAPKWDAPAAVPPQSTFVTAAVAQDPAALHEAYLLGQEQPAQSGRVAQAQARENGVQELPPIPEGMHQVHVFADQGECWMGFEPDGKKQQRMLRKGDSYTMMFRDDLQLRLGNAAAVRIIYDGKELDRSIAARPVNMTFPQAQP